VVVSRPYRLALEAGLTALLTGLVAFGIGTALRATLDDVPPARETPASSGDTRALEPLDAYAVIATRDVFNPGGTAVAAAAGGALRLWGTGLHGGEARAVIEDTAAHRQDLYRIGDEVGGARIAAIDWDRVTLTRGGAEETLELVAPGEPGAHDASPAEPVPTAATPTIRRTGANGFVVDRREIAGAVDNMSGLLTQLRAVAEVQDGRPAGFRLFQLKDDSLFRRLGLENGDVVQRVNGNAVGDPAALLGFLSRLRTEPRVALDVVRGGTPRTLVYELR
jgi:general secretion pathway protein C